MLAMFRRRPKMTPVVSLKQGDRVEFDGKTHAVECVQPYSASTVILYLEGRDGVEIHRDAALRPART